MQKIQFGHQSFSPSKIICVGRNYVEHIEELHNQIPDEIVLFIKPNSSISHQLYLPKERCRFEAELSFLVQNNQFVGVGFGLDLTLIDVQKRLKEKGLPWEKSKAFDFSACFSVFVPFSDLDALRLELKINGKTRQFATSALMIHQPQEIFDEIQRYFTLEDGDIIMTGTPKGVGLLEENDRFEGVVFEGKNEIISQQWQVSRLMTS